MYLTVLSPHTKHASAGHLKEEKKKKKQRNNMVLPPSDTHSYRRDTVPVYKGNHFSWNVHPFRCFNISLVLKDSAN